MSTLNTATREVLEKLTSLGIAAWSDPRYVDPPGVLLMPETLTFDRLDPASGRARITWEAWVLAPDTDAVTTLSDLLDAVTQSGLGVTEFTAISVNLPNLSPDPLPAFSFYIEMEYTP